MREPYIPLFCSITDSTIWSHDAETCKVFITMLTMADPEGFVASAIDGIAGRARLPVETVERAVECLSTIDMKSRNKTDGGRRVIQVDRGWHIPAIPWFRDLARKEAEKARKREWARANNSGRPAGASAIARRTETETETKTEKHTEVASPPAADAAPAISVAVEQVWDHWRGALGKSRHKLDAKRQKIIRAALKSYTLDEIFEAINGCAKSDFHMGRLPGRPDPHNGIELILRDGAHIDRFREFAARPSSAAQSDWWTQ
jgi:hypothetical protein